LGRSILRSYWLTGLQQISYSFHRPEDSLPFSQQPASGPHCEPAELSPNYHSPFFTEPF
jgi:hypothetical protein